MSRYRQGTFKPKNPEKYTGTVPIIYRSSWELKLMMQLDNDESVEKWSSESVIIPYRDHKNTVRRYFVDFLVYRKGMKPQLIEVKPYAQTQRPLMTEGKATKTKIREVLTYDINQRKWAATRIYCEKKGWDFIIMTEHELGIPQKVNKRRKK